MSKMILRWIVTLFAILMLTVHPTLSTAQTPTDDTQLGERDGRRDASEVMERWRSRWGYRVVGATAAFLGIVGASEDASPDGRFGVRDAANMVIYTFINGAIAVTLVRIIEGKPKTPPDASYAYRTAYEGAYKRTMLIERSKLMAQGTVVTLGAGVLLALVASAVFVGAP
jgi:hypothetical protein